MTSIGTDAFTGCDGLTSVNFGHGVTSIPDGAFAGNATLTSVTIPGNVTEIGDHAFEGCKNLTNVTISYGVTRIGIRAFAQCTNLKTVTIPASVIDIGNYAFAFCTNLQTANVPESLAAEVESHGVFFGSSPAIGVEPKVVYYNPYDKARTWNGALRDAVGNVAGTVQVKVGRVSKKGAVKVSATVLLMNGKKVTAKAKTIQLIGNGIAHDSLVFKAPVGGMDIDLNADGSPVIGNAAYEMRGATVGGSLSGGANAAFSLADDFDLGVAGVLQDQLLPWNEPFEVVGNKWKFAKNATVKLSPDKTSVAVDAGKGKTNLASLKLTYTSKTGLFKGSFKAYALETVNGRAKLKKYTVNVTGVVVDGTGYGQATCKKPAGGPWAVMVQ